MNPIVAILIERDGLSQEEAEEQVLEAKRRCEDDGEDPESILLDEFGLECDYVFDLMWYGE